MGILSALARSSTQRRLASAASGRFAKNLSEDDAIRRGFIEPASNISTFGIGDFGAGLPAGRSALNELDVSYNSQHVRSVLKRMFPARALDIDQMPDNAIAEAARRYGIDIASEP